MLIKSCHYYVLKLMTSVAELCDWQEYVPKVSFNDAENRTVELNRNLILQTLWQTQLIYRFRISAGS